MTWWWLSFCDPKKPEGAQFLGCSIVPGGDMLEAVRAAHVHGCNPHGEVLGMQIPEEILPPERYRMRLMTRAEAEALDAEMQVVVDRLNEAQA